MTVDAEEIPTSSLLETVGRPFRHEAENRQLSFDIIVDPNLGRSIVTDSKRLQQVLKNLLSNAFKFTAEGGVTLRIERASEDVVTFSVIDTGIGIRPDFLPHVFERFRQADSSTTRRHGGLGLGLAIVKQLTELQGGTVRAKSPGEGQGSTFVINLPILVAHEAPPEKARPKEDEPAEFDCSAKPLSGIRVLVVDDEGDARTLVRRILGECGAEVAVASSVDEAMPLVEGFRPDVAKPVDPAELVAVVASLVERTGGQA